MNFGIQCIVYPECSFFLIICLLLFFVVVVVVVVLNKILLMIFRWLSSAVAKRDKSQMKLQKSGKGLKSEA